MQHFYFIVYFLLIILNLKICESSVFTKGDHVLANNSPLCVFLRKKDVTIDNPQMPNVMVFCSCVVVSSSQVLTSRSCFVQENWLIYKIAMHDEKLTETINESNSRKIMQLIDFDRVTLIEHYGPPLSKSIPVVKSNLTFENCRVHTHLSFHNVSLDPWTKTSIILSKIWTIDNEIYSIPVTVEEFGHSKCYSRFLLDALPIEVPPNPNNILCITAKQKALFDLCATDLGAPIICANNTLVGIIYALINRPYTGIQTNYTLITPDIPSSCFTNLAKNSANQMFYIGDKLRNIDLHLNKLNKYNGMSSREAKHNKSRTSSSEIKQKCGKILFTFVLCLFLL